MNKKTTILGVIAIVLFGSLIWYFGQKTNAEKQAASVLEAQEKQAQEEAAVEKTIDMAVSDGELILGSPDAPVTMIEYSSHLCGHCASFHQQTLPLLIDKYVKDGQLKIVSRLLSPVELGLAVLCAKEQGKAQEMSNYLFDHVREFESVDDLKASVNEIEGMDVDIFNECFELDRPEEIVVQWFESADKAGVEGTPTFFINGRELGGNQPASEFERIIEEELAK